MERYRTQRKGPVVDAIFDALEVSGARVVRKPSHKEAPFEFLIELPNGDRRELVCYAFEANRYGQGGRPAEEHRFQIKYGSDFKRPHDIFIDPSRSAVTLFLGVHLQEQIFVAVDPAMHNPTWFSSSVEFKTQQIREAQANGWFAWERDRSNRRRKAGRDAENWQSETVIAFTPDNMLRFIELERVATGLDAGERLLLAKKLASKPAHETEHPLEELYGLSAREILDVIWGRFRLGVAVRGGVAEFHLGRFLRQQPEIESVIDLDQDGRPDFEIKFNERTFLVECKNVKGTTRADGSPQVDFQKTRAAKGDPCSRYYDPKAFDVLAACLHPVTERWEFRFTSTAIMNPHPHCEGKLASNVVVGGDQWKTDILRLLT